MNVNKLFKMLSKTGEDFTSLDKYRKILGTASRVAVDFSKFKDFEKLAAIITPVATSGGLVFPFDNVMFDIIGLTVANPATGKRELQPLMLHTVPIQITTDISTFHIMLVQDMRALNGTIFPRSHIVRLEKNLAIMPAVDEGMPAIGCKCFERNPMSMSMLFKQIQSFTPGFVADCGFALSDCKSNMKPCQQLQADSREVATIAITAMMYSTLPPHAIIKVTEEEASGSDLKNKPYYVVCDEESYANLMAKGFPTPLKIQDAASFEAALTAPAFTPTGTVTRGQVTYEVMPRPSKEEVETAAGDPEVKE